MTDRETLRALIERVEQAKPEDESCVLVDALVTLHGAELLSDGPYYSAMRMWLCGAYLSVAASLVPATHCWVLHSCASALVAPLEASGARALGVAGHGETPPLALTAAALRARLAEREARYE